MLRLLVFLLWLPLASQAQTYPEPLSDTVSDYANLLPPDDEARIVQSLQEARDETGVHIVLVTIDSKATYGGTGRFADFATGWFNAWGIGDADRDDGILILIAQQDREMRIALGEAYGVTWDGRAQRVLDTTMLPAFRNNDYIGGIEAGVASTIDNLARAHSANGPIGDDDSAGLTGFLDGPFFEKILMGVALFGFAAVVLWSIFKGKIRDVTTRFRRCPNCGARSLAVARNIAVAPGDVTDGMAVRREYCTECGQERQEVQELMSREKQRKAQADRSSDFGGGRSGGGGASGKW